MSLSKVTMVVVAAVAITTLLNFLFWRSRPSLPPAVTANACPIADNSQVLSELSFIKNQLSQLQDVKIPPTTTVMGLADILPENNLTALFTANAYATPEFSGQVVGHIKAGKIYPYLEKKGVWYQVKLEASGSGWVASQYVKNLDSLDLP